MKRGGITTANGLIDNLIHIIWLNHKVLHWRHLQISRRRQCQREIRRVLTEDGAMRSSND
jgi:hypothetical protein